MQLSPQGLLLPALQTLQHADPPPPVSFVQSSQPADMIAIAMYQLLIGQRFEPRVPALPVDGFALPFVV